ncbi:hypothetical protein ACERK3_01575 [Phycisphaerales bacterium AB-hyl4]|uniref:PEP-CTERM protein-sorting domain-containing protein n=1 Tax=Natronomicrosphaera hydrolytica TaxID=3242702 RepID=A0ABV4U273_9BACT
MAAMGLLLAAMPMPLHANDVTFEDGGEHDFSDGAENDRWNVDVRDSDSDDPTTLNVLDGAWIDALNVWGTSLLEFQSGATTNTLDTNDSSSATLDGGTYEGSVSARDDSQITILGGTFEGRVTANRTHIHVHAGTFEDRIRGFASGGVLTASGQDIVAQGVRAEFGGTVNIEAGTYGGDGIYALHDSSTFNISGGTFTDQVRSQDSSNLNISGGIFQQRVSMQDNSIGNVTGGTLNGTVRVQHNAEATFSGGTINRLEARDGPAQATLSDDVIVDDLRVMHDATMHIVGGTFTSAGSGLFVDNTGTANISGGSFDMSIWARDEGVINISGGEFNSLLSAEADGVINLSDSITVGSDLRLSGRGLLNLGQSRLTASSFTVNVSEDGRPTLQLTLVDDMFDGEQLPFITVLGEDGLTLNTFDLVLNPEVTLGGGSWQEGSDLLLMTYNGVVSGTPALGEVSGVASYGDLLVEDGEVWLTNVNVVPEPGSLGLASLGGLLLLVRRRG